MYQAPVKGKSIKKTTPAPKVLNVSEAIQKLSNLEQSFNKLHDLFLSYKDETSSAFVENFDQVNSNFDEISKMITYSNNAVKVLKTTITEMLSTVDKIQTEKATIDEDKLLKSILAKIPKQSVNENQLISRLLKSLPERKGVLKIIQSKVEVDPMSVIEKIMALPKSKLSKLKLTSKNIDGLEQTISAFRNQLGRGYLHGGGISEVIHDATLTGKGTKESPLSAIGSGESFETISKNLKSYPYAFNKTGDVLDSITYTLPYGIIIKTFNRTGTVLDSVVLSGDTPSGIALTKTFNRVGTLLTDISYS